MFAETNPLKKKKKISNNNLAPTLPPLIQTTQINKEPNGPQTDVAVSLESIQGAAAGMSKKRLSPDLPQNPIPAKMAIPNVLLRGPAAPNIAKLQPSTSSANVAKILATGLPEILAPPVFSTVPMPPAPLPLAPPLGTEMHLDAVTSAPAALIEMASTFPNERLELLANKSELRALQEAASENQALGKDETSSAIDRNKDATECEMNGAKNTSQRNDSIEEDMEAHLSPSNPSLTAISRTGMFLMRSVSSSRSKGTTGATNSIPQLLEDENDNLDANEDDMDDKASVVSDVSESADLFDALAGLQRESGAAALAAIDGVDSNDLFDDGCDSANFEEVEDVFSQTGFEEAGLPSPDAGQQFAEMMAREYHASTCLQSLTPPPPASDLPASSLKESEPRPLSSLTPPKDSRCFREVFLV
jgi:hypothetical protein